MDLIPFPDKKYQVIYADPPWHYKNYVDKSASRWVGNKYPVMTVDDICNLPVQDLAADTCALFMWVTFPMLEIGFDIIKAWGFTYKTIAFSWVKTNKKSNSLFWGMGYYTRSNTEICILATKGNSLPRISHSVHSVIMSPIEIHSKKPDCARDRVVELFGNIPRIELFARQKTEGWDVWGNEV